MSPAGKQASPLRIRGTPRHLAAIVPELRGMDVMAGEVSLPRAAAPAARYGAAAERQAGAPDVASFPAFVFGRGELRLNLPRDTPPGVYEGKVRIGDREQQVTVEIEPRTVLRLFPKSLHLAVGPKERVDAELTVVNEGNVPATIPAVDAFWLLHEDGVDRVLGLVFEASRQSESRGKRIDRVLDAVDEQYGGNVRLRIEGAGAIEPGESRTLQVHFVFPERLQGGQCYIGMWHLCNLRWPLHVTVKGEATQTEEAPS